MSIKQKNKGNITKPCFLTLIRITMVLLSSAILVRYMKVYPRFGKRKQSVIFTCFVDLYIQTVFSKVVDTRLRAQWFCGVSPQLYSTLIFNVSFSLWFILFLGEFSKMAAVYLHRPPYPPRGESLSPCRLLGGGGGRGVAWPKRRMTFETTRKWWSFLVLVSGWLELCQTFKNSPMFSNVKKEHIWIQRRSAKSGDRCNFTMSIQELRLKFKEILK